MGLDMYLEERKFIGANYPHSNITGEVNLSKKGEKIHIPLNRVSEIVLTFGYWRKANQIHKWFVDNVQDGTDDCKSYYCDHAMLKPLKTICEDILAYKGYKNPNLRALIEEKLPPESGFFFGSTELDTDEGMEYYISGVQETVEILSKMEKEAIYYYTASW